MPNLIFHMLIVKLSTLNNVAHILNVFIPGIQKHIGRVHRIGILRVGCLMIATRCPVLEPALVTLTRSPPTLEGKWVEEEIEEAIRTWSTLQCSLTEWTLMPISHKVINRMDALRFKGRRTTG